MALPLLAAAKVATILGPTALKAAKLAYKMYKKRGGKKTEQKFLSDKANRKLKDEKKMDRELIKYKEDKLKEVVQRQKNKMGKDKFPSLNRKAIQKLRKQMDEKSKEELGRDYMRFSILR